MQRIRRFFFPAGAIAPTPLRPGHEVVPLLVLFFTVASLFVFIKLAIEVIEGETRAFDTAVLLALRNAADLAQPIGPGWVGSMLRDATVLGGNTVLALITIGTVCFLTIERKRGAALFVLVSVLGGVLISNVVKAVIIRPRPDVVPHLADVASYSFPSGHATLSAVTFLTLGALLSRVQRRKRMKAFVIGLAILLTLLVGVSRVYLGVHWPTDVLAGWLIGAAWSMGCWLIALWLQHRGYIESPDGARQL